MTAPQPANVGSHHVLVVDDDDRIRDLVSRFLREQGYMVITAHDAAAARACIELAQFDLVVADVMMPGENGINLTRFLHQRDVPVLLLTALGETDDRVSGLEAGADDYLPKPFEPRELVLRIEAILRRRPKLTVRDKPFRIGKWRFDPDFDLLSDGQGAEQKLTPVEARLLKALASRAGDPFSRDDLAKLLEIDAGERTIDVQVTRLRRKLEDDAQVPRYLQTVRGKGYLLRIGEDQA